MVKFTAIHYKILGALNTLDGMLVTIKALSEFLGLQNGQTKTAVDRLVNEGYVCRQNSKIAISNDGASLFQSACKNPDADIEGYFQFRNEALTGCDSKGKQSTINNAALPSNKKYRHNTANKAHDNMMDLAKQLNLETEQCAEWIAIGKIKQCSKCDKIAVHTMRNGTANSPCNKCMWIAQKERKK